MKLLQSLLNNMEFSYNQLAALNSMSRWRRIRRIICFLWAILFFWRLFCCCVDKIPSTCLCLLACQAF